MKVRIDKNWVVDFPDEFFISPFRIRLDLTAEQFERWEAWFFAEFVKCDMFSCAEDDEYHGVENVCGCTSIYYTYVKIAERLPFILEPGTDIYYPMYDSLQASHVSGSGLANFEKGKPSPIDEDELRNWKDFFPKRSCVNCTGRYGDTSDKICSHDPEDEECDDECFDKKFQSWCPLMNTFMEADGWEIDHSLEKFATNPDLRVMPEDLIVDKPAAPPSQEAPKIIKDFMKKANETTGENDERRKQYPNN